MIRTFDEMMEVAISRKRKMKVAVVAAQDPYVLEAVCRAQELGLIEGILIGPEEQIQKVLETSCRHSVSQNFTIIDMLSDTALQSQKAVELILSGEAECLMKGLVDTRTIIKAVLKHKKELLLGKLISYVAVFETANYPKLLFMSDPAIVVVPNLQQKIEMIENALPLMYAFGIDKPNIATICAKETEDEKMPATRDAQMLYEMNQKGKLDGCQISGPIAFDGAISPKAAKIKKIDRAGVGDADFLLMPSIECGNLFYKTMNFMAKSRHAGILLGCKMPFILTSRSDDSQAKLYSIALATMMSK